MSDATTASLMGNEISPSRLGLTLPPRPVAGHRNEDLVALARRTIFGTEAWSALAPYLAFDERQYRRVRLFRNEHWEGLLLCWLPGHATSVHDHGGSVGMSFVLSGTLTEERWRIEGAGLPLAHLGGGEQSRGDHAVELLDTIHRVSNAAQEPAVSLHVYSPPLRVLGAHDPALGKRWEVPVADSPDVQVGGDPELPT
jgi:predicted metal-dependent enzyme (double-stranded beta helix superfamily)